MKLPKKVFIVGAEWKVIEQPHESGGSFNTYDQIMKVGTEAKQHIFGIFLHEIIESILTMRGYRYESSRGEEDYLFSMNHKELTNFTHDLELALKDVLRR